MFAVLQSISLDTAVVKEHAPVRIVFFNKGFDNHGYFRFLKSLVKKRFFKIRTNIKTI